MTLLTRADYLAGKCTHKEYYLGIARELPIPINQNLLVRVRESVDRHLNDIPLSEWDGLGRMYGPWAVHNFRARGDYVTRAGMVSLLKVLYLEEAHKT